MVDFAALLNDVATEEVRVMQPPVDVPDNLKELLYNLRDVPGAEGGRQRAILPVTSLAEVNEIRRTLRAAGDLMDPKASVTTVLVYADDDQEEFTDEAGKRRTRAKADAVPTHIKFSVGERRGRKGSEGSTDTPSESDGESDVVSDSGDASVTESATPNGKRRSRR